LAGAQLDDKGKVVGQFQLPAGTEAEHFTASCWPRTAR